jgi:hypothetical protein
MICFYILKNIACGKDYHNKRVVKLDHQYH